MKVLILGGNGFIGSHLVDRLSATGNSIRVFDRFPEHFRQPLPNIEYHFGNMGDAFALAEALTDIDIVYHLACTTVPSTSNTNPVADVQDNLLSTLVLLDQMIKQGVKRIVFLSSGGTVYGNPLSLPIPEEHPLRPICSYGVVKVAIENYLFMYQQLHGLEPVIIRPSNPYGPRQGHLGLQGLIATFLNNIKNGKPLTVWGDGSVVRDFLYVSDLAGLCMEAGSSHQTGVFNAGYGSGFSVKQVIENIREITGINPEVRYEHTRLFDVKEVVLDISKCSNIFAWQPKISFADGLAKHWKWLVNL